MKWSACCNTTSNQQTPLFDCNSLLAQAATAAMQLLHLSLFAFADTAPWHMENEKGNKNASFKTRRFFMSCSQGSCSAKAYRLYLADRIFL